MCIGIIVGEKVSHFLSRVPTANKLEQRVSISHYSEVALQRTTRGTANTYVITIVSCIRKAGTFEIVRYKLGTL